MIFVTYGNNLTDRSKLHFSYIHDYTTENTFILQSDKSLAQICASC